MNLENPLIWIDLEMTGLDLKTDKIIEIACIITDGNLGQIIYGPNLVIHQPSELLSTMDSWCTNQHGESGLTKSVHNSKISISDAESEVLKFVQSHIPLANHGVLAGNSVHVDRQFLCAQMPNLISHLHYRIVDVSSIKVLSKSWYPDMIPFEKKGVHRALGDIAQSIAELRYYRTNIFR